MLDFVIGAHKRHYPQRLLEEGKYDIKYNKVKNPVNDELDFSSSNNRLMKLIMMNLTNNLLKVITVFL